MCLTLLRSCSCQMLSKQLAKHNHRKLSCYEIQLPFISAGDSVNALFDLTLKLRVTESYYM